MGCGSSTSAGGNTAKGSAAVSKNRKEIVYADVKVISDGIVSGVDTTHVLVDCRTTEEVQESGTIPGSIVIPLDELEAALKLTPDEFQAKYQVKKFTIDNKIVVFCLRGMRSEKALGFLKAAGYDNSDQYSGSWIDWCDETRKQRVAQRKSEA